MSDFIRDLARITGTARIVTRNARGTVDDFERMRKVDPAHRAADKARHEAREMRSLYDRDLWATRRGGLAEDVESGRAPSPYYSSDHLPSGPRNRRQPPPQQYGNQNNMPSQSSTLIIYNEQGNPIRQQGYFGWDEQSGALAFETSSETIYLGTFNAPIANGYTYMLEGTGNTSGRIYHATPQGSITNRNPVSFQLPERHSSLQQNQTQDVAELGELSPPPSTSVASKIRQVG